MKPLSPLKAKRAKFDNYLTDPTSKSFGDKQLSAKRAGMSKPPRSLVPATSRSPVDKSRGRMLTLAESNLIEFLELSTDGMDAATKLRVKADVTKFVAETLGRDTYSKRSELTGKNGGAIVNVSISDDEFLSIIKDFRD